MARFILAHSSDGVRCAMALHAKRRGHNLIGVASADHAIAAAQAQAPHVLITDFWLNDGPRGAELVNAIRSLCPKTGTILWAPPTAHVEAGPVDADHLHVQASLREVLDFAESVCRRHCALPFCGRPVSCSG